MASSTTVPLGSHYETKCVALSYSQEKQREQHLSSPQGIRQDTASRSLDQEILLKVKTEIEEELKSLDEETSEAFASTRLHPATSAVFSRTTPDSSAEDGLAHPGEKASQELRAPLRAALRTPLSRTPATHQARRQCTPEATVHASGRNKTLVPPILLRPVPLGSARRAQEPGAHRGSLVRPSRRTPPPSAPCKASPTLASPAQRRLRRSPAPPRGVSDARQPRPEAAPRSPAPPRGGSDARQPRPEAAPTPATASWRAEGFPAYPCGSQSWRTEGPPVSPESWRQVAVDPEEVESLDSNGAGEKSESKSSNSELGHVEKEGGPEGAEAAALP
ncbi:LOW QUALITY PROTEIN: bcl-2-like protein 13 [Kogia breviceps]|uniref:LOW QUALITY PROTEIN: bcl-2-like protein 13 n=1 Tax=Kogia breviceps TaxID=27615 RepID=UPI0034D3862F